MERFEFDDVQLTYELRDAGSPSSSRTRAPSSPWYRPAGRPAGRASRRCGTGGASAPPSGGGPRAAHRRRRRGHLRATDGPRRLACRPRRGPLLRRPGRAPAGDGRARARRLRRPARTGRPGCLQRRTDRRGRCSRSSPPIDPATRGERSTRSCGMWSATATAPSLDRLIPGAYDEALGEADLFFQVEMPAVQHWQFGPAEAERVAATRAEPVRSRHRPAVQGRGRARRSRGSLAPSGPRCRMPGTSSWCRTRGRWPSSCRPSSRATRSARPDSPTRRVRRRRPAQLGGDPAGLGRVADALHAQHLGRDAAVGVAARDVGVARPEEAAGEVGLGVERPPDAHHVGLARSTMAAGLGGGADAAHREHRDVDQRRAPR